MTYFTPFHCVKKILNILLEKAIAKRVKLIWKSVNAQLESQTGGKSWVSLGNFHPITAFLLIYFAFVFKFGSHFSWQTAELSPDNYMAPWLSPATSGLMHSPLNGKRSALWPCEVGTSDFNHVSNYNANGAAAIFSAAPPTFNISAGKGRRSLSNSNKRLRSIFMKWNKSTSYPHRGASRRETFHHIPLAFLFTSPVTQFQLITAHQRLWQWVTLALYSARFIIGQGEMFWHWRLKVWVTLRQLRLLERDTLTG